MSTALGALHRELVAVCPVAGVCLRTRTPPTVEVQFASEATQEQRAAAQAVVSAFDWSDAAEAARQNLRNRTAAKAIVAALTTAEAKALRAVVSILLDELNTLRQWDTALKVAVAAATNFADLKTRIAALSALPNRTMVQAQAAVATRLDEGTVD